MFRILDLEYIILSLVNGQGETGASAWETPKQVFSVLSSPPAVAVWGMGRCGRG